MQICHIIVCGSKYGILFHADICPPFQPAQPMPAATPIGLFCYYIGSLFQPVQPMPAATPCTVMAKASRKIWMSGWFSS